MVKVLVFIVFNLVINKAFAQGSCVNINAASSASCSPGLNDATMEADLVRYGLTGNCNSTNLSTDGQLHCLPQSRSRLRRMGFTSSTANRLLRNPPSVANKATEQNIRSSISEALSNQSNSHVQINISGHGAYQNYLESPDGLSRGMFSTYSPQGRESLTELSDLLDDIQKDKHPNRPIQLTFDYCFAGNSVDEVARRFHSGNGQRRPVCAIGASGKDEFSEAGRSLAKIRYELSTRNEDEQANISMGEVFRAALLDESFESVPSLTSNAVLLQYADTPQQQVISSASSSNPLQIAFCVERIGQSEEGLANLNRSLGGAESFVQDQANQQIIRNRLLSMGADLLTLLRRENLSGCGTIAYDNPQSLNDQTLECLQTALANAQIDAVNALNDIKSDVASRSRSFQNEALSENLYLEAKIREELLGVSVPELELGPGYASLSDERKNYLQQQARQIKEQLASEFNNTISEVNPISDEEDAQRVEAARQIHESLPSERYAQWCADLMHGPRAVDCPVVWQRPDFEAPPRPGQRQSAANEWENMQSSCARGVNAINTCNNSSGSNLEWSQYYNCERTVDAELSAAISLCNSREMSAADELIFDSVHAMRSDCIESVQRIHTCNRPKSCWDQTLQMDQSCMISQRKIMSKAYQLMGPVQQNISERFHERANEQYARIQEVARRSLNVRKLDNTLETFSALNSLIQDNSTQARQTRANFAEALRCEGF